MAGLPGSQGLPSLAWPQGHQELRLPQVVDRHLGHPDLHFQGLDHQELLLLHHQRHHQEVLPREPKGLKAHPGAGLPEDQVLLLQVPGLRSLVPVLCPMPPWCREVHEVRLEHHCPGLPLPRLPGSLEGLPLVRGDPGARAVHPLDTLFACTRS